MLASYSGKEAIDRVLIPARELVEAMCAYACACMVAREFIKASGDWVKKKIQTKRSGT
jgi:hypothetical protein